MKNSFIKTAIILFTFFSYLECFATDFNFEVTEIQISDNGNTYNGINGGTVTTDNGIKITSNSFKYNKLTSLLETKGNVVLFDKIKNITIRSEQIFYLKDKELVYTLGKSKTESGEDIIINSNKNLKYNKLNSILEARGDVEIIDKSKNITIRSEEVFYFRNEEKFFTKGLTKVDIENRYFVNTKDLLFLREKMFLSSEYKTVINDISAETKYKLNRFEYAISKKFLKGDKIQIITDEKKLYNDQLFFDTGFFDLANKKFIAKDVEIIFDKTMYDNTDNDPRVKSASGSGDEFNTYLEKAVFTICKNDDKCPPWKIESKKIRHDKIKKQIIYDHALLKVYNIPVLYYPKFFHPDPSVERQSGFLKPYTTGSSNLGRSINTPYFYVLSANKDLTFKPRLYTDGKKIFHGEYRVKTKKSFTIADFSLTTGHSSNTGESSDNRSHLYVSSYMDLALKNFRNSDLKMKFQETTNDTYLKLFSLDSPLLMGGLSSLETSLNLDLAHDKYDLTTSMAMYETLSGTNNDRYQYVMPSYNFSRGFSLKNLKGSFNFNSNGTNVLNNTNTLETSLTNDLNYTSSSYFLDSGLTTNFGVYLKNYNAVGKKSSTIKSTPEYDAKSFYVLNTSFPLVKNSIDKIETLMPKVSFRFSPDNMKNSGSGTRIGIDNSFSINRLGLNNSFEDGESMTIGIDYSRQRIIEKEETQEIVKFFDMKLATVFRTKKENNIPAASTLNEKQSNIFGKVVFNPSEYLSLNYNYSTKKSLDKLEYNSVDGLLTYNDFFFFFNFTEENTDIKNSNIIETRIGYDFDENNSIRFNTRRNRTLALSEYYNLVYEYKNDCLEASLKYKKNYYTNADIKPLEELFFTITIIPLATFSPDKMILSK